MPFEALCGWLSTVLGTGITATSTRKFARAWLQSSSCGEFAAIVPTDVGSPSSRVIVADIKPGLGGLTWLRLVIMIIPGGVSSRGTSGFSHCLPCLSLQQLLENHPHAVGRLLVPSCSCACTNVDRISVLRTRAAATYARGKGVDLVSSIFRPSPLPGIWHACLVPKPTFLRDVKKSWLGDRTEVQLQLVR